MRRTRVPDPSRTHETVTLKNTRSKRKAVSSPHHSSSSCFFPSFSRLIVLSPPFLLFLSLARPAHTHTHTSHNRTYTVLTQTHTLSLFPSPYNTVRCRRFTPAQYGLVRAYIVHTYTYNLRHTDPADAPTTEVPLTQKDADARRRSDRDRRPLSSAPRPARSVYTLRLTRADRRPAP